MTFGQNFVDTFSNNLQQDKNKSQPLMPVLSNKAGINKKKSTALQQQIVGSISTEGFNNGFVQ